MSKDKSHGRKRPASETALKPRQIASVSG